MDYKGAGVNVELGDDASRILYNASKLTWGNRKGRFGEVAALFDDFSGGRMVRVGGLPADAVMNLGFDGVGTKVEIAERVQNHRTVAHDLFAMVCDDAVVRGAEPVLLGSILDVNSLGKDGASHIAFVRQLAQGYVEAAREAGVAVVNGEVAELSARVRGYGDEGAFNYNWGAGIVWFGHEGRLFSGNEIKPGDRIIALKENGFRSNGLSLVRKIMSDQHGPEWHRLSLPLDYCTGVEAPTFGDKVLEPSRIYSRMVVEMTGGFLGDPRADIHGVAHITGGGIPGKLGRVLKRSGLGAVLDNLFDPPKMMRYVQDKGHVSDEESYRTWNMGQGMLIIAPRSEEDSVRDIASQYDVKSQVAGEVVSQPGIVIRSKGVDYAGLLSYNEYLLS